MYPDTGNFFKLYGFSLRSRDRQARANVNATHSKTKAVFENPNTVLSTWYLYGVLECIYRVRVLNLVLT